VATADGGAVCAAALMQQAEHLLRADEREADEGSLQRVEHDEDVPEHGEVGQRGYEAEQPRQSHDRRQLHVEEKLAAFGAAGAFRVFRDDAQVLDGDNEEYRVDDEEQGERQGEQDQQRPAASDPTQSVAVVRAVIGGEWDVDEVKRE